MRGKIFRLISVTEQFSSQKIATCSIFHYQLITIFANFDVQQHNWLCDLLKQDQLQDLGDSRDISSQWS